MDNILITGATEEEYLRTSSQLLVHFDSALLPTLVCDASAYSVGAVLAHRMLDGSENPFGYFSRTLNNAERNYSQLEKIAYVFGLRYSTPPWSPFLVGDRPQSLVVSTG